jgi:hypothetical protein
MSMLCDKSNMVPLLNSEQLKETDKAYFVSFTEAGVKYERWIPKSQARINKVNQFCVPQWMFDKLIFAE